MAANEQYEVKLAVPATMERLSNNRPRLPIPWPVALGLLEEFPGKHVYWRFTQTADGFMYVPTGFASQGKAAAVAAELPWADKLAER